MRVSNFVISSPEQINGTKIQGLATGSIITEGALFEDDFLSYSLDTTHKWDLATNGASSTAANYSSLVGAGLCRLLTDSNIGDYARLRTYAFNSTSRNTRLEVHTYASANTNRKIEFGLLDTSGYGHKFIYDSTVDGNWHCQNVDNAGNTDEDSGVAISTSSAARDVLVIDGGSSTDPIKFYHGTVGANATLPTLTEVASISGNLDTGTKGIECKVTATAGAAASTYLDLVRLTLARANV